MPSEQHLPYRSTADVVVLDGDGSRWVRETNGTCPARIGTCPNNVQFSPKNGGSGPIASRKPIRKVEAYLVVDFGGSFGSAWEYPVRAFTDYGLAKACKRTRELRRIDPDDETFRQVDYVGSYIKNIEVVIDDYDE